MNLRKPRRIVILDGDEGPTPQEHVEREWAEVARWLEETSEPKVGASGEADVLQALDPFWTRGIVLNAEGPGPTAPSAS